MTAVDNTRPWTPGPHFMLRVAGLPIDTVHRLRSSATTKWADSVLHEESSLRERGSRVSELLHNTINANEDDRVRRGLINLRRQVHNNRLPNPDKAAELVGELDNEAATALTDWMRDRRRLDDLMGQGQALSDEETAEARKALRELATEPRLRMGLQLASPSLDTYLDSYLAAEPGRLSKRHRRIERSLLEYVYRTACKTSPFSTFTSIGLGRFTDADVTESAGEEAIASRGGPSGVPASWVAGTWSSHPRINVAILNRLADAIVDDDGLRDHLQVALTLGWQSDVDRIRYVRRSVTAGQTDATVSFDTVRDNLFVLRNSEVLARVFTALEREESIRWADLTRQLGGDDPRERAAYGTFLRVLLRLGLLRIPALQMDIHARDPLRGFSASLRSLGAPFDELFCPGLEHVSSLIDTYATADTTGRRQLLSEVRAGLEKVAAAVGTPPIQLPVTLVFEDTRIDDSGIGYERQEWMSQVGESLRSLERIIPAFDITLPHRIILKGFFVARFGRGGRCDDLLKLVHDFNEDIFEQYVSISSLRRSFEEDGTYVPHFNWLQMPEFDALDRARVRFAEYLREAYKRSGSDDDIILGDDLVADMEKELGDVPGGFRPLSHFIQMSDRGRDTRAVLNRTYGGVLFPFSRFTHCFDDDQDRGLVPQLRGMLRTVQPDGAVFAELTGGHATTNLNLHGRLTDYEIVCPGESTSTSEERKISLDELYVEHDEAADRLVLRSKATGREVVPLYLGYLVPVALPAVPRTLLLFSPSSTVLFEPWSGVPAESSGPVTVRPQVRYRNVIVSRKSWTAGAGALPGRRSDTPDSVRFLDWQRWRREHGVPSAVFVTAQHLSGDQEKAGDYGMSRLAKPQYIDFNSRLSLLILDSLLQDDETTVVFREMVPAEDGLSVTSTGGRHVAEMAVETYGSRGIPTCTSMSGDERDGQSA